MQQNNTQWQWQLRHAIRTTAQLQSVMELTADERKGLENLEAEGGLPLMVTPHVLSCMQLDNPQDPIRLQLIPRAFEWEKNTLGRRDPLGEEEHEVVPHLVHRYPDRVLFLVTDRCASYCRYCTRKRWVGQGPTPGKANHQQALDYIATHPDIKEVILSGGDALMLGDGPLRDVLQALRAIPHVEIIRLHTRMLTFCPMRVTPALIETLQSVQPVYIVTQFNHPNELSAAAQSAIKSLIDVGIVVLNQSVLLRGINDNKNTMEQLLRGLVKMRVRPYYLHQCDVMEGIAPFRVPLDEALALIKSLRGHISGLCMPQFVIDIPGGFGKVPLVPDPILQEQDGNILLEGFAGEQALYPAS